MGVDPLDLGAVRGVDSVVELVSDGTRVPIDGGRDVEVFPGMPWPSAYRGSKYSVLAARGGDPDAVLQWQYDDLRLRIAAPDGLLEALREVGKSGGAGTGSVRITAGCEVLTKVHTDHYAEAEETPISDGWVPVYLGRLYGELPFEGVDVDPVRHLSTDSDVGVWDGLTFDHGERWALGYDGSLVWKWRDYRFESAFDHSELASKYGEYRPNGGRLYINEYGHVFGNVPQGELGGRAGREVSRVFEAWNEETLRSDATAPRRLVVRRLEATGGGDPSDGHLPLYLGHLEEFDSGLIPQPVVDDPSYYKRVGEGEQVHG